MVLFGNDMMYYSTNKCTNCQTKCYWSSFATTMYIIS